MTDSEKLLIHDEKFNSVMTRMDATNQRIDDLIGEFREFKNEMREKDNQRREEISEIRQLVHSMHNQNIAVIVGVVAIAVAVFLK